MEYGNGTTNQLIWQSQNNRYHNMNFDVRPDNVNVNVAVLSGYVQPNDRILDVGCGEGKLGAILKDKNCTLYGIDMDAEAAAYAESKNNYKKVYLFNIESADAQSPSYAELLGFEEKFDCIALVDVLEHLINPTQAVLNVLPLLKKSGKLLISVPNVNNADIFLNLLRDRFNYCEAGVLDNTHTKYFTKRSFVEWIQQINTVYNTAIDCTHVGSIFGYTDYLEKVKEAYPKTYQFIQMNPYFHVIQHMYVLTVTDPAENKELSGLQELLNQEPTDLVTVLEQLLSGQSVNCPIAVLPNERKILTEMAESAQRGWESAKQALDDAAAYQKRLEAMNTENARKIEKAQERIRKLETENAGLKDANKDLKNANRELVNTLYGPYKKDK